MARKKREVKSRRKVRSHRDSSIANAIRSIERVFGLPKGAVRLIYPKGRAARRDSTVGALRRRWEK